ncbi:chorismate mutase [Pseudooceanicola sp. LIPI14-2-Ac024]|uniref:chorismate mutase n=1 Tax=Pseudooceanicola sp. LIPI14-2-Ac024 TaxID=3344875 RepID=UPI0035CED1A7
MGRAEPSGIDTMADLRGQIDAIDGELLSLLAERQRHVDRAVVLKQAEGIGAAAPGRVAEVLAKVRGRALDSGLDPAIAGAIWQVMIEGFIAREERILGKDGTDR